MTEISFSNVVIVAAVAFAAPLVLGLIPKLRLPAIVLEIGIRIAIGPSGLGSIHFKEEERRARADNRVAFLTYYRESQSM